MSEYPLRRLCAPASEPSNFATPFYPTCPRSSPTVMRAVSGSCRFRLVRSGGAPRTAQNQVGAFPKGPYSATITPYRRDVSPPSESSSPSQLSQCRVSMYVPRVADSDGWVLARLTSTQSENSCSAARTVANSPTKASITGLCPHLTTTPATSSHTTPSPMATDFFRRKLRRWRW